jgi:Mg2+/Co2+ transporter CorB
VQVAGSTDPRESHLSDTPIVTLLCVLLVLILLSGFFSSAETAMMSLNRYRLRHLAKTGHKGARRATQLLQRPDKLLGLILIGNNLINNAAAALAGIIAFKLYGDAGVAAATLLLTLAMLIFAEVTPKTIAAYRPESIAFPASRVLQYLMYLLYPAVWLINMVAGLLVRLFGINTSKAMVDALSTEELRTLMATTSLRISAKNRGMLVNILDLEDVDVDDIMVPRNEIVGIDLHDDDATIEQQLRNSDYNRLPVFSEDINNIVGILHLRKTATLFKQGSLCRDTLREQLSEPHFILENTLLNVQLHNFQKRKQRLGIVVDEYGAVLGLVTLEDILEEIVGEFVSDTADSSEDIQDQADGSYIIDGTATVRDINRSLNWELPTEGPRTLNGLLLEELESIPTNAVGLTLDDYQFEITDMDDKRIKAARARRLRNQDTD